MFVLQKIVSKINNNKLLNLSLLFSLIITISFVTFSLFSLSLVNEVKADSNIICPLINTNQDLFLGSINEDVRNLQKFLNNSGFILAQTGPGSIGRETNYFGYLTRSALTRFQTEKNISNVNLGALDFNTRKYLNCQSEYEFDFDPKQDLSFTSVSEDVRKLQRFLNNSGFILAQTGPGSFGRETNYFGVLTRAALTRFQALNKVAVNDFGSLELNTRKFISDLKDKVIEEINDLEPIENNDLEEDPSLPASDIEKVYSLRGRITGLQDDIILLNKINGDELFIKVDDFSAFSFSKKLASGEKYEIIIKSKTTDAIDNQNCFVKKPIGFVEDKDITNLEVMCGDVMTLVNNPFDYVPTSGGGSDTQTYTLTYSSGSNGSIMGTSPQTIAENSSGSAVSAVPDSGYSFVSWSDGVTSSTRVDSSVSANVNVTANFAINTYTINYSAETGGSVSGTLSQTVDYNSSTTQVEAIPNPGYTFISWSDDVTSSTRVDSSINSNATYTASFGIINISSPLENAELNLDTDFTISGTSSLNISSVTIEASNNTGTSWIQIATTTSDGSWSTDAQLSSDDFSEGDTMIIKVSSGVVEKEINVSVVEPLPFIDLDVGWDISVMMYDNKLYSWGNNYNGDLGIGTEGGLYNAYYAPVAVSNAGVLAGKQITKVSSLDSFTLALDSDGKLYSWGLNTSGQLGNNSFTKSNIPVEVDMTEILEGKEIVEIAAGREYSIVMDREGKLYSWGHNDFGELGNNSFTKSSIPVEVDMTGVLAGKTITQISAFYQSLVLDSDGQIYAWGEGSSGVLGNGKHGDSNIPVAVNTSSFAGNKIVKIGTGYDFSVALDESGQVYVWGQNNNGIFCSSTMAIGGYKNIPVEIDMTGVLNGKKIVDIDAGFDHILALDSDGILYAWGKNNYGQLGNGVTGGYSNFPVIVDMTGVLAGKTITKIRAGGVVSVVVDSNNEVYSWGNGSYGQLGNGKAENSNVPTKTTIFGVLSQKKIIKINGNSALDLDGKVYTWNSWSAGYATYIPFEIDTTILSGKIIIDIQKAIYNTMVLDEDGKIYASGSNGYGQLGNNSTTQSYDLVEVDMTGFLAGKTIVKAISSYSNYFSVALDSDGKLYSWGRNSNLGQLGIGLWGAGTDSFVPVEVDMTGVLAGKTITDISVFSNSIALDSDGKVYSWGSNSGGILGNGSIYSFVTSAVEVNTSSFAGRAITQISAGGSHILVLDEDGKLYSWGSNAYGQLGNNSSTNSNIPVEVDMTGVLSGKTITKISAGENHSMVLDSDGKIYTWGYNYYGVLGNGLSGVGTNSPVPVEVDMTGVLAGKTIIDIVAEHRSSFALDSDGYVYAWGNNGDGQGRLGIGNSLDKNTPYKVYRGIDQF